MAQIFVAEDNDKFQERLLTVITENANNAISTKDKFYIGISGGSCVKYLVKVIQDTKSDTSKWVFFLCDERVVQEDSADSNYGATKSALEAVNINIPESQFVRIKQGVSAQEAADDYIAKIKTYFTNESIPQFDLLFLGMGPDGHTCSLFPGHPLLNATSIVASITDSPKPPSERITLTLPVLNNANCVLFAVAGEEKAPIVKKILVDGDKSFPAALVTNPGKLLWILDPKAGKYVK
ncbi:probable 6-phosphogluconolactonase [Chrysoperla carnea]|uniref:probable 6-phosphogluconolactonase n=1 Tax=Chrysoperla carnea TaxID=189513 RepID=UPI001D09556E|nr:probable 6-phosphogluconolactonase [Chrysoperla carnea]